MARFTMRAAVAAGLAAQASCSPLRFALPTALWALWLVPAYLLAAGLCERRRRRRLAVLVAPQVAQRVIRAPSAARRRLGQALFAVGLAALVLALARPRWGFTLEEVHRQGVDVVVALDVSESMLVEDAEAAGGLSRLAKAKREVTDLLRLMEGDRIALVPFAGSARVLCPLTLDYGAAKLFLDEIDTESVPVKGTAIADAIRAGLKAVAGEVQQSPAIILITDGEDHVGKTMQAAEEAKAQGVRIFAIGIGRSDGAPIPAEGGGFHRDRTGNLVMSRLDESTLQGIAQLTGGRYVRSQTGEIDLEAIYRHGVLTGGEAREHTLRRQQRWQERFQWPLALALLAWALEAVVAGRKLAGGLRRPAAGGPAAALAVLALASIASPPLLWAAGDPAEAYARGDWAAALEGFSHLQVRHPHDPALLLALGSTYYRMEDWARAEAALSQAAARASDRTVRARAHYALGNTAYRRGQLDEAAAHYRRALEADPAHEHARANLDFVREEFHRRRHEKQDNPDKGDKGDKSDDEKGDAEGQKEQEGSDPDGREGTASQEHGDGGQGEHPDRDHHGADDESAGHAGDDPDQGKPQPAPEPAAGGPPNASHPDAAPPAHGEGQGEAGNSARREAERILDQLGEERPRVAPTRGPPRVRGGKDW